jgi:small subunit ribosomal protein S3
MGQKVNPIGLRLGINKTWKSRWYVDPKEYAATLHEDLKLRRALAAFPEVQNADVSDVEIVRQPQRITLLVNTARPGVLIGAKGANIERISGDLQKLVDKKVSLKIKEIKNPMWTLVLSPKTSRVSFVTADLSAGH